MAKYSLKTLALCAMAVLMLPASVSADKKTIGIVTGSATGTYVKFGNDIKGLLKTKQIDMDVHTSAGSLENVYSVYKLPKAQLGIVQSDVLAFIKTRKDGSLAKIAEKLRLVHPLYNEEVHILASNDVSSFEDLEGRKIAVGTEGSGTFLTADTLLKISGINAELVNLSGISALAALKNGEVDAMFYVAGYPVKLFTENVTEDDKLQLLPIQNKDVSEVYNVSSTIPRDTYDFLGGDVDTVAVKAVLITFAYKRANCGRIGNVANIVEDEIDWLRANGHQKWKEVDLSFELNGWTQYECVKPQDPTKPAVATNRSPGLDAFLKAVSEQ